MIKFAVLMLLTSCLRRIASVNQKKIKSPSRAPVLSFDNYFQAPPTQASTLSSRYLIALNIYFAGRDSQQILQQNLTKIVLKLSLTCTFGKVRIENRDKRSLFSLPIRDLISLR